MGRASHFHINNGANPSYCHDPPLLLPLGPSTNQERINHERRKVHRPHHQQRWRRLSKCGGNEGYRNTGDNYWGCCDAHMVKWCIGSGLFPPEDETPDDWERNAKALEAYQEVEPIFSQYRAELAITKRAMWSWPIATASASSGRASTRMAAGGPRPTWREV